MAARKTNIEKALDALRAVARPGAWDDDTLYASRGAWFEEMYRRHRRSKLDLRSLWDRMEEAFVVAPIGVYADGTKRDTCSVYPDRRM
jgi:hypothetical protein